MSAGPIQAEREAHRRPDVSTPNSQRVCKATATGAYCGRTSAKATTLDWAKVVCADCVAAARADGAKLPPIDRPTP